VLYCSLISFSKEYVLLVLTGNLQKDRLYIGRPCNYWLLAFNIRFGAPLGNHHKDDCVHYSMDACKLRAPGWTRSGTDSSVAEVTHLEGGDGELPELRRERRRHQETLTREHRKRGGGAGTYMVPVAGAGSRRAVALCSFSPRRRLLSPPRVAAVASPPSLAWPFQVRKHEVDLVGEKTGRWTLLGREDPKWAGKFPI
jgi:hypothetical protein